MRNFHGTCLLESSGPGGRGTKMRNRCSSPECKCHPPAINVHHYQCPLMRIPCPIHGYPFVYYLKSKNTPLDQRLVISFQPSLKNDKLFEPVKTFLSQTCEPDTEINFQYYSPRLSETYREGFKHRQVQTNPEDLKKATNSCFVEKTKTFFSDKTNKIKKLKQCFNSPCSSIVHKSRSCTAIKEKIDRIFREGTEKGYSDKSKLEKRIKAACRMKSEESSHFLYKRDLDLSDGEKSSKEKTDSDFITRINSNLLDRNVFDMRSRKGFNGRVSANMKPHFVYQSFVSPDPIKEKAQDHDPDLERTNERSQNPDAHFDEPKEDKEEHNKASPDGNTSSDSSSSVYFTPFIFVPGRKGKEVEHKRIQTLKIEGLQTIEYFHESVSKKSQSKNSEILVAKTNRKKTIGTQTSVIFMPEACTCGEPQMTSDEKGKKINMGVQTSRQRLSVRGSSDFEGRETVEPLTNDIGVKEKSIKAVKPVSVGIQTEEKPVKSSVLYYEPEMKFLKREEMSENKPASMGVQTEENFVTSVVYYQPETKFLRREEMSENKPVNMGVQPEENFVTSVVYYQPETKCLRREEMSENKPVSMGVQPEENFVTSVVYYQSETKFLRREEMSENKPVSVGGQPEENFVTSVVYYQPEMKFLRREKRSKKKKKDVEDEETSDKKERNLESEEELRPRRRISSSAMSFLITKKNTKRASRQDDVEEPREPVELQIPKSSAIVYYEPEMKFLSRAKSSESVREVEEPTQSNAEQVAIIFEPEMKPLRRKDESGKRGVLFNEETQIKEIETGRKDESVGIEPYEPSKSNPKHLEESDREREKYDSGVSQNKETQAISDSDTSQSYYYDGSDSSNATYVVKSYASEESEQVVVRNWNKSRSDGDVVDKKKCECPTKAGQVSPPETVPNGLTFVTVYRSKKESYSSSHPQDSKKNLQFKPETVTKKNEDNNASFADLSDLIRIIDENFKKIFDRTTGMCECRQTRERKPTADKEVMTDISGGNDINAVLQMATRPTANAQIQASLPILEEMPLPQFSNPDQEPSTMICKVCSKVKSMTTVSVGTNIPDESYIQTKIKEVDATTCSEEFPMESIEEASGLKPESIENPSASTEKSGIAKNVTMSAKTYLSRLVKPSESKENHTPTPTPRKTITYSEPFSDSTTSLQRDLRRAQKEFRVKPKSSLPRPTPKPRQAQLPQSKPQVVTQNIPDAYCGNIVATVATRPIPSIPIQERCVFEPPSTSHIVCPPPPDPNPGQCCQRTQPSKEPEAADPKQNYMTYHVTLSPLRSKNFMKMFQRKPKKISKSASSDSITDSSGKQKRSHDDGSDGCPIGKKIKSIESETTNIFDTNLLECERIDCFEFGKSQTNIIFNYFMKGENELVLEEESPQLTKDSGFVWVPSFPTPQFFRIRQVSSAEETAELIETPKEVCRRRYDVLSNIPEENNYSNLSTKNTYHHNPDYTGQKNLITKLLRCSSCKSLAYVELKDSDIIGRPKTNSTIFKSNLEDSLGGLMFTPHTTSLDNVPENASLTDEQISPISSEQKHVETVPSIETKISSSGTDQTHKFFELSSKFLSEKSDSNFEIVSNQVGTCDNSELIPSNSGKAFNVSRSNKFSFHESSADVSNSKMATKSECLRTHPFLGESSTVIPDSKKTVLKNLPSKIFQGSKRKFK